MDRSRAARTPDGRGRDDDVDAELLPIGDREFDRLNHAARCPAAGGIEHLQAHHAGARRHAAIDPLVHPSQGGRVAVPDLDFHLGQFTRSGDQPGHMGAMAVVVERLDFAPARSEVVLVVARLIEVVIALEAGVDDGDADVLAVESNIIESERLEECAFVA
jgi:hypothetical protein